MLLQLRLLLLLFSDVEKRSTYLFIYIQYKIHIIQNMNKYIALTKKQMNK